MAKHRYFRIEPSDEPTLQAVREAYGRHGETALTVRIPASGPRYLMDEPLVAVEEELRRLGVMFTEADPLNGYARGATGRKLRTLRRSPMT